MLVYWHYSNPDSLEVTREMEKELLENSPVESENR
jgi:hypothetical protein